ncbi:phosphoribosylaminoimidazolesuccinocarboxamide synthase [Natronorubrum daqingense]|uniref:Phosphoribosylaminoimidazole-succinocarboxamide synthase n=1 Tax=Natronorubrum daqingense TaxID=588898 RepID=A0A1P8REV1_9EURY|nr:phosphoribosylaminoimidazolesuccinocarboxamide synthase [Natronorubrum daqingense]APX97062.1 phosphoribosylaminoimidazolesuccinocarboxamide synthase [Natronorubrum daqingense]
MTSVKEFRIDEAATADELGRGTFVFTDAYSVFDWGKMPDQIPEKGASLCAMGAYNFELLESEGVPTHYRGVLEQGEVVPLEEASRPPWEMAIDLTQVPDLPNDGREYDYDHYHEAAGENYLIPLEIVFRNRVPIGSSLRRRTDPSDHGLDFDEWPEGVVELEEPIVEFSTKYEEGDRYLAREEADAIAGRAAISDLESLAREVNRVITEQAESADLVHEDGKIECLYYGAAAAADGERANGPVSGEVRVADVVGTFDENRFSYEGTQLSKEVLRQYHKRTQPEWVQAVKDAKAEARESDVADWKSLCEAEPDPLEDDVIELARNLYCAGANAYTGHELFDAPPLSSAIGAVQRL